MISLLDYEVRLLGGDAKMKDDGESRQSGIGDQRPSVTESLSDSAINEELRSKALFNPWTVLPLILVIVTAIDLLIKPLFPDGIFWTFSSIAILIVSVAVTAGSFIWQLNRALRL